MIINFADAYRSQKPDMGNVGGCRHFGKRLLTLLLDTQKLIGVVKAKQI